MYFKKTIIGRVAHSMAVFGRGWVPAFATPELYKLSLHDVNTCLIGFESKVNFDALIMPKMATAKTGFCLLLVEVGESNPILALRPKDLHRIVTVSFRLFQQQHFLCFDIVSCLKAVQVDTCSCCLTRVSTPNSP